MRAVMCHQLTKKIAELELEAKRGGVGFVPGEDARTDDELKKASIGPENGLAGMLHKMAHIALICSDAEKSKRFYCDFLGPCAIVRVGGRGRGPWAPACWTMDSRAHACPRHPPSC